MTLSECLIYFIVYSFLGWAYESLYYSFQLKKLVNAGFLRGCICPIYGLACIGNILLLSNIENNFVVFFVSMTVISSIEYVVSFGLEKVFGKRWWDYSKWPMNINGRISLITSVSFGIMSLIQLRLIHPPLSELIWSMSDKMTQAIILIFVTAVFLDLALTIRAMEKNDEEEDKLWFVNEELPVMKANEKLSNQARSQARKVSERCDDVKERIKTRIGK